MPEIRFEMKSEVMAVIDGYCSATGRCRTEVISRILAEWSDNKLREADYIMRVAGRIPGLSEPGRHESETERHLKEAMKK